MLIPKVFHFVWLNVDDKRMPDKVLLGTFEQPEDGFGRDAALAVRKLTVAQILRQSGDLPPVEPYIAQAEAVQAGYYLQYRRSLHKNITTLVSSGYQINIWTNNPKMIGNSFIDTFDSRTLATHIQVRDVNDIIDQLLQMPDAECAVAKTAAQMILQELAGLVNYANAKDLLYPFIAYRYGGICCDIGIDIAAPFVPELDCSSGFQSIGPATLASVAEHPLSLRIFSRLIELYLAFEQISITSDPLFAARTVLDAKRMQEPIRYLGRRIDPKRDLSAAPQASAKTLRILRRLKKEIPGEDILLQRVALSEVIGSEINDTISEYATQSGRPRTDFSFRIRPCLPITLEFARIKIYSMRSWLGTRKGPFESPF